MRNSKHGLKALVMGIMVMLGAMALAAGAQAQTHEELLTTHAHTAFLQNPNPLTHGSGTTNGIFLVDLTHPGPGLVVSVNATQKGIGVLLVKGRSIEIRCSELALNSGKITALRHAEGEATFSGCHVYDHKNLTLIPECVLKTLLTIVAKTLVLPIIHNNEGFLLFEPVPPTHQETLEGKSPPFATPSFKPNMGCTLPLNNPVTGAVVALIETLEAVKPQILLSEGIQLLAGDLLTFGGFAAYIKAEGLIEAIGAHTNDKLGVHPELQG